MTPKLAIVKDFSVNCVQTLRQVAVIMFPLHSAQDGLCSVTCMLHVSFHFFLMFLFTYLIILIFSVMLFHYWAMWAFSEWLLTLSVTGPQLKILYFSFFF